MAKSKELIVDFTEGSVPKQLIRFALPFMLSTLLQTLYSTVDTIVVGQYVGSAGLSGVSIAGQIMWLTMTIAMGIATAGQILISQKIGIGDRDGLKKTIGTLFTTVAVVAVIITVVGILFHAPLLHLLDTPEEAWDDASNYLIIIFAGTIFTYGYNLVSSILRGMGDSTRPFIFVAIAAVTNLLLDLLFVAVLDMGAAGAAWATIIGQALSFLCSVIYLYHKKEEFSFDFKPKSFQVDTHLLGLLIKLGIPLALQNSAISISMMFVNKFINQYGVAASATFGTGTRIEQFPWVVVNGIMMATVSMVAQNMGAGKTDRAKKVVHVGAIICTITAVIVCTLFTLFPVELFSIFTTDPEVLALAPSFMLALTLSVPATTIMNPYNAFIQGIGNATLTLIIALLDGFVARIAISLFLAHVMDMGLMGWFLGYGMAAYVNFILSAIYFYSGVWKKRKALV